MPEPNTVRGTQNRVGGKTEGAVIAAGSLSTEQAFLKGYRPEEDHWTSGHEMMLIRDRLNLDNQSMSELEATYERVTRFYERLQDAELARNGQRTDKWYDYLHGMYSVQAVIQHVYTRLERQQNNTR